MIELAIFFKKIDQISEVLNTTESESIKLKEDLLTGIFLDLTSDMANNPELESVLNQLSKTKPSTEKDFDQFMSQASGLLINSGYDLNSSFDKSARHVLKIFMSKLDGKLPEDKIVSLNRVLSEE